MRSSNGILGLDKASRYYFGNLLWGHFSFFFAFAPLYFFDTRFTGERIIAVIFALVGFSFGSWLAHVLIPIPTAVENLPRARTDPTSDIRTSTRIGERRTNSHQTIAESRIERALSVHIRKSRAVTYMYSIGALSGVFTLWLFRSILVAIIN